MSKIIPTLIIISIFLFATLSQASRPHPQFLVDHPGSSQQEISEVQVDHVGEVDELENENCEGIGNEECLMRRTLVAHIDYIYTQKQKP